MKTKQMLLVVACLLAPTCVTQAQRTPPTPAEMAEHEVQRYTALLSLTSAQQTEALTIFTAEATSDEPLHTAERTLHTTLKTAVTSGDTAALTQAATSLGQIDGQVLVLHATAESQLYQLLTADQRTRFATLEQAHLEGRGRGGPGGPNGPPQ